MSKDKIVVLGIGNILLSDEGVGVKVVQDLESQYAFPENVELVDGGVGSFSLLPYIESAKKLLVIDAISGGKPPGTIYKFKDEEIPYQVIEKLSTHELNFSDILNLAKLRGKYPEELVIIGIEPQSLELKVGLTDTVKQNYKKLLNEVLDQLKEWGIEVSLKQTKD
ncbi:MAG: HyaD/HybD family hydrogenase maturation endopeptidase [Thermodesulfobacterium geofontis]|uniref:HyaD/HybD family hydrogenase maturation endopeptidase n=1 Tax=Thermodesulfobacterium geofontis TaxID=1295609 RepID=A0A2N7Q6H1_9BACT|nr:MAG: HyaD/HybD family hydrogenase maturation endopeptidase [Thermodesulfobacterium geofontis]